MQQGNHTKYQKRQMLATDSQIKLYNILKHWFIICGIF